MYILNGLGTVEGKVPDTDTEFYKALDQPDSQFRHEQILKKEYEILQPLD